MLSFENFVKSMPPSLSELKVTPSFCFAFKIPDDRAASNTYVLSHNFFEFSEVDCIYSGPCALQLWSEENLQGRTRRAHNWHKRSIFNSFQIKSLENYGDCCWYIFR